jgi:predicted ATP-grasp superfamily ATP-dependent carboligase
MDRMTRVFVYETTSADPTCADAELRAQGRSMRDAMVADLATVDGVQVTCAVGPDDASDPVHPRGSGRLAQAILPECPGLPERPGFPVCPSFAGLGEQAIDFLKRQAALHELVWVVAPESGGMLAALCGAVPEARWIGCSRRAITLAASKRATALLLRTAGISTTEPFALGQSPPAAGTRGAWVVKPDDGCGAAGVRRHAGFEEACADYAERQSRHEPAVMETWIEGEPLSLSLLCGAGEVEVLAINRQSISVDQSGFVRFDGVTPVAVAGLRAQAMASLARKIVQVLPGLGGFVGVDVTWHPDRGPVVIEINPRVTCAYEGLSRRLGRNVAQQVLATHRRAHGSPSFSEWSHARRAVEPG